VSSGEAVSIVIVEDHELLRQGLRSSLERNDEFRVLGEACDGPTGVRLAVELKPDVVILDIGLPGFDGIEATRQIKQAEPEAKVIMLTMQDSDEHVFAALAAGAFGYCLKDLSGDKLKRAVKSVSEGAAWIDPRIATRVLGALAAGIPASKPESMPGEEPVAKSLLSQREIEVLRLIAEGMNNKEISDRLFIGVSTVRTHVEHILEKLAVDGRTEAAVKALREGLI
jgi:DNA-binding NarL/FixJ family response regulator